MYSYVLSASCVVGLVADTTCRDTEDTHRAGLGASSRSNDVATASPSTS